ncbi:MAG: hypothetical protein H6511_06940 [Holophagales bacterium]|nr:hypothetical protein [Holophagales bacterium]
MPPTPPTGPLRRALPGLAIVFALLAPAVGVAQVGPVPPPPGAGHEELGVYAFTLEHQRAAEALEIVQPLLSARGTVELQAGTNTLVVRDSLAALGRVRVAVRAFDHPARPVSFDVQIVKADPAGISPVRPDGGLDPALRRKLETLFRFQAYRLLSRARIDSREGEEVTYEMPGGFRLSFKVGALVEARRLRLHTFRIVSAQPAAPERELIHSRLTLWLEQPLVLGLARDEASPSALFLVLAFANAPEEP